jgi:hypothetical protein
MNYSAAQLRTYNAFKRNGMLVTVSRFAPSKNEQTGAVTKGTATTTCTPYAVLVKATEGQMSAVFANALKDGTLVGKRMRLLKLEAVGQTFEPLPDDEITFGGETWVVKGCTPVKPTTVALAYTVGVVL